ncbi:RNA-binding protein 48-like [Brachyhypopomus gauderio]|uniref:RNA-binding protein 48-like n=1 Tax=Brachyhypopomus gauderio TaxID=698409 RepID=UPI004041C865
MAIKCKAQLYKHHQQQNVCSSRPKYREGRKPKAVKVYTINLESRFLLVQGVPAIGVMAELVQLFALYGVIEEYRPLDEYPAEQFTEVYLLKFQKLTSARAAKRNTDEKSFFGGLLHVCYAPEYETVEDTRKKLQDRRRYVNRATKKTDKQSHQEQSTNTTNSACEEAHVLSASESESSQRIQGEVSSFDTYSEFPLLPLPPQHDAPKQYFSSKESVKSQRLLVKKLPTEDKMGSLHSFIPGTDLYKQNSHKPNLASHGCDGVTGKEKQVPSVTAPRLIPRTAHLENRKRKMEESLDLMGIADKNAPLYGPKLPEPPKMDMEDDSLNITANLIRQTMTKVASDPPQSRTTTTKPRLSR